MHTYQPNSLGHWIVLLLVLLAVPLLLPVVVAMTVTALPLLLALVCFAYLLTLINPPR